MDSLNKNGVRITQTPGEEKYVKCCLSALGSVSVILNKCIVEIKTKKLLVYVILNILKLNEYRNCIQL